MSNCMAASGEVIWTTWCPSGPRRTPIRLFGSPGHTVAGGFSVRLAA